MQEGFFEGVRNLPNERNLDFVHEGSYFSGHHVDSIKFKIVEGTTLTFLGLLKYDVDSDTFKITDPIGCVAGGLSECKDFLKERYEWLSLAPKVLFTMAGVCLLASGILLYRRMSARRR